MKTKIALGLAAATAALCAATPAAAQAIPNSYICTFDKAQVGKGQARAEAVRSANANGGSVKFVYEHTIRGFAVNISAQGAARLQALGKIENCEQDQVMQIVQGKGKPPKDGGGGDTGGSTQATPWGIARVNGGVSGASGTAWIIDSGIDLDHPDLNVDTSRSFNAVGRNADDENGHGTHVAGTVAAIDNDFGVIGVAAGATVVSVRVLDRRGSGSTSGVIAGIDYVGANGAAGDVANMSLGGGYSQALNDAVIAASSKVKFVLAAGNESTDAATKSPASANGANIYTISSFAEGDRWSSFSNYGNPPVDFAEPGSAILSTYKGGQYATLSGTSMAAPHAAGILLLGGIRAGGSVSGDPDGNADTIGVR